MAHPACTQVRTNASRMGIEPARGARQLHRAPRAILCSVAQHWHQTSPTIQCSPLQQPSHSRGSSPQKVSPSSWATSDDTPAPRWRAPDPAPACGSDTPSRSCPSAIPRACRSCTLAARARLRTSLAIHWRSGSPPASSSAWIRAISWTARFTPLSGHLIIARPSCVASQRPACGPSSGAVDWSTCTPCHQPCDTWRACASPNSRTCYRMAWRPTGALSCTRTIRKRTMRTIRTQQRSCALISVARWPVAILVIP